MYSSTIYELNGGIYIFSFFGYTIRCLNSSSPRNMEQFGNGGKKCAHTFEVPITFLELF